jgi:hypothetical protein
MSTLHSFFSIAGGPLDQRYRYLRNGFVEIIMCVSVTKVILLTLILGLCLMQYPIILRMESVDYRSMSFEPDAHVLLQREPTDCHGCQFSSPNLRDGWSINFFTGDIKGIAEAGDQGSIQVYATTKAGVVNTTVYFEVAPRFTSQFALKGVDVTKLAWSSAILVFILQPWPR